MINLTIKYAADNYNLEINGFSWSNSSVVGYEKGLPDEGATYTWVETAVFSTSTKPCNFHCIEQTESNHLTILMVSTNFI